MNANDCIIEARIEHVRNWGLALVFQDAVWNQVPLDVTNNCSTDRYQVSIGDIVAHYSNLLQRQTAWMRQEQETRRHCTAF